MQTGPAGGGVEVGLTPGVGVLVGVVPGGGVGVLVGEACGWVGVGEAGGGEVAVDEFVISN